jgi:hypothetical protein
MKGYTLFEVLTGGTNSADKYDVALTAGRRSWCTGVDDAHAIAHIGSAYVVVNSDALDLPSILAELKNGNFYATNGAAISSVVVEDGVITITTPAASEIKFIGKGGTVLKTVTGAVSATYTILGDEEYVRAEITRDSDGKKAFAQPIFITKIDDTTMVDKDIESSYTPVFTSTSGTNLHTYGTQFGTVVKQGKMVWISVIVSLTAKDAAMGGYAYVNLPYAPASYAVLGLTYRNIAIGSANKLTARVDPVGKNIGFFEVGDRVGTVALAASKLTATSYFMMSGWYRADE